MSALHLTSAVTCAGWCNLLNIGLHNFFFIPFIHATFNFRECNVLCLFKCFNLLIHPVPANCKLLLRQDLLDSFGGSLMLVTSHRNLEALMNWVDLLFVFFRHVLIKPLGLESQQPAQYNWKHTSPVENSLQTRGRNPPPTPHGSRGQHPVVTFDYWTFIEHTDTLE